MAEWDAEWQERQQHIDAVEHAGAYAEMVLLEDEARERAVSKASDMAWDAAKPVIDEHVKAMVKAVITEMKEAPPDALDMVAKRLGCEVDEEWLTKDVAMSADEYYMDMASVVSDAVRDALFKALRENE